MKKKEAYGSLPYFHLCPIFQNLHWNTCPLLLRASPLFNTFCNFLPPPFSLSTLSPLHLQSASLHIQLKSLISACCICTALNSWQKPARTHACTHTQTLADLVLSACVCGDRSRLRRSASTCLRRKDVTSCQSERIPDVAWLTQMSSKRKRMRPSEVSSEAAMSAHLVWVVNTS